MVIALSFAMTARTDRAAADTYSDMHAARLLTESSLERALSFLYYTYDGTAQHDAFPSTSITADNIFQNGSTNWAGHRYFVSTNTVSPDQVDLERALRVNYGFDYTPSTYSAPNIPGSASWQHVRDGNGDIIGRLAFIVIDESGKLDPNGILNFSEPYTEENNTAGYGAGPPADIYDDWDGNGSHTNSGFAEGSASVIRRGFSPSEIFLGNALPAGVSADEFRTSLSSGLRWLSLRHIRNAVPSMDATKMETASKILFPFSYPLENEYCRDTNGNEIWESGETGNRYNIGIQDWDTAATVTTLKTNIPWISGLVDSSGNDVSNQVAANFIDFCDSNQHTTHDFSGNTGTWSGGDRSLGTVSYSGVEECPYISEIQLSISHDSLTSELRIGVTVELVNMYLTANNPVTQGDLTLDIDYANTIPGTAPSTDGTLTDVSKEGATLSWNVTVNEADNSSNPGYTEATYNFITYSGVVSPYSVSINIDRIVVTLNDATTGDLLDVASVGSAASSYTMNTDDDNCYADFCVGDPRSNTLPRDWHSSGFSNAAVPTTSNSWNSQHPSGDPSSASPGDTEDATQVLGGGTATDPETVSTAFVRDEPPKTYWEIGAIHRGEDWCTLNLKQYNYDGSGNPRNYVNGDSILIDQIKIGTGPRGKLNLNSPVAFAWQALLAGLTVGADYLSPNDPTALTAAQVWGDGGTPGNTTDDSGLVRAILDKNGTQNGSSPFVNRGKFFADITDFYDGTAGGVSINQENDRQQEEIIGKIANLVCLRHNYFRVIATAQAVRDLSDLPVDPTTAGYQPADNWVNFDTSNPADTANWCAVLAEQKIEAIIRRDIVTNQYEVVRYNFVEE
ncbi:MAG: hypothetical protein K9N51_04680 [Candidatus Pacebacteria bacterium]|nr:hypothetical protein [Candidatus Paceibacterota bacterium]